MSKHICAAVALAGCGLIQTVYADTAVTENTTVGGRAFIDLTSLDSKAAGVKTAASGVGLDVKRFYLILDHTFDDIWSANLTTDCNYVSADSETQLFIKKAYVQAKLSDAFFVRAGFADLPWIHCVEGNYGYRYVEKMIEDRVGFGSTADWGVHAGGKMADGMFGYAVSTIEGNGYKNPTRSKTLDWEGRVNFSPIKGLTAGLGFYNGKMGKDVEGTLTPALHTAQRWDAVLAYSTDMVRVGGEYLKAGNLTAVILVPKDSADGYSVWGAVNFTPKVSGFARYDKAKPNKDTSPTKEDQYFNLGVSCKPRKGVDLAVVYKHDEVKTGGAKSPEAFEFGVCSQISF